MEREMTKKDITHQRGTKIEMINFIFKMRSEKMNRNSRWTRWNTKINK